jgi:uncharacterized membrane protein
VSQIWSFIFFPLSSMVLILKSIPIVEMKVVLKASSENLNEDDFHYGDRTYEIKHVRMAVGQISHISTTCT